MLEVLMFPVLREGSKSSIRVVIMPTKTCSLFWYLTGDFQLLSDNSQRRELIATV